MRIKQDIILVTGLRTWMVLKSYEDMYLLCLASLNYALLLKIKDSDYSVKAAGTIEQKAKGTRTIETSLNHL